MTPIPTAPRLKALFTLGAVLWLLSSALVSQTRYDGILLDRPNRWDSYPAHMFLGGKHYIWWCSQSTVPGAVSLKADGIFFAQKTGSLGPGGWTGYNEVLNNSQTIWAHNHVCDASVLNGSFSYGGSSYAYALYWTSDTGDEPVGVDNAIGVAFSNNRLDWTVHPSPIIQTYFAYNGSYGAGAPGAAFDSSGSKILIAYDDTTLVRPSRAKESNNAVTFSPSPPYRTDLYLAGRSGSAGSYDIAFNPADGHWYAAMQTTDEAGNFGGETRIVRSTYYDDLFTSWAWDFVASFDQSITGSTSNNNPGLGKNANSTLYVDSDGWAYVFFGTGNVSNPTSWAVAQGRFRPTACPAGDGRMCFFSVSPCRTFDSRTLGPPLVPGSEISIPLAGVCGIPATAGAVSVNVTGVDGVGGGEIRLYPAAGQFQSALPVPYLAGDSRAESAIVPVVIGNGRLYLRALSAQQGSSVHVVIDVNGYFAD